MPHWLIPAAIAFICWGMWAFLPKLTTRFLDPKSAIIYEVAGGIVFALVVLVMSGFRLAIEGRGILLAAFTGVLGFAGALAYLIAVLKGPVTLISTVTGLYPILAVVLAYVFLNEPISVKQGIGILLGLVAIILISG